MNDWLVLGAFFVIATALDIAWRVWRSTKPRTLRMTFSDPANDQVIATAEVTNADEVEMQKYFKVLVSEGMQLASLQLERDS